MKILLIRPRPHRETIGLQSVMICEPLELMQLSSTLKANGHQVVIADMILEKRSLKYFIDLHQPDAAGITGYISHVGVIKKYAEEIKGYHPSIRIAVGGVHAAVCPLDFQSPFIDKVCRSAEELYDYLSCETRGPLLPDRQAVRQYADRYYYLFQDKCALIKTSFGCPYHCNFCFCKEIEPYRARDVDSVIRELLAIPQQEVYIVDDDFLFNRGRLLEFCEKVARHGVEKRYLVYGRADFIAANEDVMAKLKAIGLSAVIVGIEAADQGQLDQYQKGTRTDDNVQAIHILRKYEIECYATVILGTDWEKKDFDRLYRFIKANGLVFVNLQPFTPMPGTPYFRELKDNLIIPYQEHEKWDMAHLVVRPGKLSVRKYYFYIISLYYKITVTPKNIRYMFRKYGAATTLKLSAGAARITWQYVRRILRG